MYLSKVKLNLSQAKNPYEQHRALWKLFPDRYSESRFFLYRVEQWHKTLGAEIIMQSLYQPEPSDDVGMIASRKFLFSLQNGQLLRFRIRANPVKAIKDKTKGSVVKNEKTFMRSVRVPLINEEQQFEWLKRKLSNAARIESIMAQQEPPLNFRKAKEGHNGKIQPVLFDGTITVTDPQALVELIQIGIGPAKAFGCGMLTLAPA